MSICSKLVRIQSRIQNTALRSRGAYSVLSVAIHIYGSAPTGVRLRQDGVRFVYLSHHGPYSLKLFMFLNYWECFWLQDCCQYHQAKDGDGWVEYKGSLVFNGPQKVYFLPEKTCLFIIHVLSGRIVAVTEV